MALEMVLLRRSPQSQRQRHRHRHHHNSCSRSSSRHYSPPSTNQYHRQQNSLGRRSAHRHLPLRMSYKLLTTLSSSGTRSTQTSDGLAPASGSHLMSSMHSPLSSLSHLLGSDSSLAWSMEVARRPSSSWRKTLTADRIRSRGGTFITRQRFVLAQQSRTNSHLD